jgi:MFS family permease
LIKSLKKEFSVTQRQNLTDSGKSAFFYGWYIVAGSWIALFLVNAVSVGIFFKPILEEFGWDRSTLSLVHTSGLLLFAFVTPFIGRAIDRYGAQTMFLVCVIAQTASSTVNGLATSIGHIFTGRFFYELKPLQASQVLINRWFIRKRGTAQGIAATGMPIGALVLSPLSQYLVLNWGWRPTMFFWAGVTFIILVPLAFLMKNKPEEKGLLPDADSPLPTGKVEGIGIKVPMSDSTGHTLAQAVKSVSFWLVAGTQLLCGIGCGFIMTHIVVFATDYGYTEMVGASLLSVQGGLNLLGVLLTGHFSDKYARHRVLALTHAIRSLAFFTAVGFIILEGSPLWMLYAAMVLFGFGWFTTSPLTSGLLADLFGNLRMGTIIGVTMSCHTIGMAMGAYAGGISFDLTGSYYMLFVIQGGLEMLAAGFAFVIRRKSFPIISD